MKINVLAVITAKMVRLCALCLCIAPMALTVAAASQGDNQVSKIDFKRDREGRGALSVQLARVQSLVDIRKSGNQLHVEIVDTSIGDEMIYVLDVSDFATVVRSIETFRTGKGVKLVLSMAKSFHYDYTLKGTMFDVVVSAKQKMADEAQQQELTYKSKPISINFQDVPVLQRRVLIDGR